MTDIVETLSRGDGGLLELLGGVFSISQTGEPPFESLNV